MSEQSKPVVASGFGYVGRWRNKGEPLGWDMPRFVYPIRKSVEQARRGVHCNDDAIAKGMPHYLCRITIEPVLDKLGRPIVRIPR